MELSEGIIEYLVVVYDMERLPVQIVVGVI